MFALSSLPGLSIETRTSKLVTLSFSTPIGEICVTRPLKDLSLKVSTRMRACWPGPTGPAAAGRLVLEARDAEAPLRPGPDAADVGFVHLAADEHLGDVPERHHQRRV